jgi:TolB-like protein/DNA-binding SARP family transcriptional activator/Flp pilus assembly protein TadD
MITFHVLGAVELRGAGGRHLGSPLAGSKRLALLAYLMLGARRGATRRDTLLGLFWPESDQRSARNALSNMLHQIRRSLGAGAIVSRGHDEVGLAEEALWCDALAFHTALSEGRLAEALELYRGELLEGLYVPGASAEFEQWLDVERSGLRSRAFDAARALDEAAAAAGNAAESIRWARRASTLEPFDERAARRLIERLDGAGDRAAALRTYEELAVRLAREFEVEPSAETRALITAVREREEATVAAVSAPASQRAGRSAVPAAASPDRGPFPVSTIAVLPFENLSGSADAEPISAGLHDDLLTELSRISSLSVIARTSVMKYRNATLSVPEIARELGVGTVVECAVQTAGGRLRLNVQVIDTASGAHRWAERYDRELSARSIFDLQVELSREIAQALRAELTGPVRRRGAGKEPTEDLEAYRLYAQGRALADQRTPHAMYRSVDYFQRAIERDPGYALAWSGLADALSLLEFYDHAAPATAPGPLHAALRAVELGPDLGQARASLGIVQSLRQQGPAALAELETAIELAPSHAEAHAWLGWVHLLRGCPAEALVCERRAVELDPLAPAFRAYLAEAYLASGEPEEALRHAARACEIQPEYGLARFMEGLVLAHLGRVAEAESALEAAFRLVPPQGAPSHAEIHAVLAVIHLAADDRAAAHARLARIDGARHPFARGLVLAALADIDGAFTAFQRVRAWDSFSTEHFRYFFPDALAALRADPRYRRMRRELDVTWGWEE